MRSTVHPTRHGMRWAPETRNGRRSVMLALASFAGLLILTLSFAFGLVESVETFSDNWLLVAWGGAVLAAGAAAAVVGVVASRRGEHSWSVTAAIVIGVLLSLLVLNEIAQGL